MAQRTVYVDDITGKEIPHGEGGTVKVGLDGVWYEVDLSNDSKAKLEELLEPYLNEERKVRDYTPSAARSSSSGARRTQTMRYSSETMAEATAWAKSDEGAAALKKANVSYSGVGRTPYAVVEAYLEASKA